MGFIQGVTGGGFPSVENGQAGGLGNGGHDDGGAGCPQGLFGLEEGGRGVAFERRVARWV